MHIFYAFSLYYCIQYMNDHQFWRGNGMDEWVLCYFWDLFWLGFCEAFLVGFDVIYKALEQGYPLIMGTQWDLRNRIKPKKKRRLKMLSLFPGYSSMENLISYKQFCLHMTRYQLVRWYFLSRQSIIWLQIKTICLFQTQMPQTSSSELHQ